jgi:beta-lactamase class A
VNEQLNWRELEELIARAEQTDGTVGVAVIPPRGDAFVYKGDRRFGAASTMKIPLMIEIYRQFDRGQRAPEDHYTLRTEDRAVGSGVMLHLHEGMEFTLNDLIYLMISVSDNTATNILIDLAGMDNVNRTMHELGMTNSTIGRKMKGRPAQGDELENWATPNDYARVIQAILDHRAASEGACEDMIAMLEKQQSTSRISRYLPQSEGIRWGSKPGQIRGVTNDVGFVTTDKGTLILSVFGENMPDPHLGEKLIGDLARAAMKITGVVEPLYTS